MSVIWPIETNRAVLRRRTRNCHERAEEAWFRGGEFGSRLSYEGWLAALCRAHSELGLPSARRLGDDQYIAIECGRCLALNEDLGTTGAVTGQAVQRTTSWAWGVQYALNGSALGASVLLKSGALQDGWPRAYLTQMQAFATSGALKRFFATLDALDLDIREAEAGAERVFSSLSEHSSEKVARSR
ncbi:heme oxygenase-like domain-containing protein [Roseobacter sinensis]|uniref:Heme oxygenase n=1 Tax=Roseobacter sinensis TaxID=2931391 RepID=A0ABT3BHT4_9RHOB|nr:hypothetical protein [Roseobacter sp. WL0113]MCV3272753.1 hypothetical protein [Roseobacter sp. WL0113]